MGSKHRGQVHEVEITALSSRGNGVGIFMRQDGQECEIEVPFTVVGDRLLAEVTRRRAGRYAGRLVGKISLSPDRIPPRCAHFETCGGCRFQQIPYMKELEIKQSRMESLFADAKQLISCPKEWHYRNKMEFSFSSDKKGERYLGLVIDSSRGKVFNLTECHICNPWMAEALEVTRQWWHTTDLDAYHPFSNRGTLSTLTLREGMHTGDKMAVLTVSGKPEEAIKRKDLNTWVSLLQKSFENISLFLLIHQRIKGRPTQIFEMHLAGPDHIKEKLLDFEFKVSPQAFFQPNTFQAEILFSKALSLIELPKEAVVFDLYCGTGVLGIMASKKVKKVIGIELSKEAVLDAKENASMNGCENIEFIAGRVEEELEKLDLKPDLVMVDPPRAGLDEKALEHLIHLSPSKILYISCNPDTQKQNCDVLLQAGYRIQTAVPVDQFPHTVHIESIVVLEK